MHSFHTFQKYLAEIFTETCFMAAILNKMQDGGHIGVWSKCKHCFSDCLCYKLSKNL